MYADYIIVVICVARSAVVALVGRISKCRPTTTRIKVCIAIRGVRICRWIIRRGVIKAVIVTTTPTIIIIYTIHTLVWVKVVMTGSTAVRRVHV